MNREIAYTEREEGGREGGREGERKGWSKEGREGERDGERERVVVLSPTFSRPCNYRGGQEVTDSTSDYRKTELLSSLGLPVINITAMGTYVHNIHNSKINQL